ncbi:MAG TPA: polysaccharide deacetylase family protein [Bacteroidia bacterium]|nr:polysaccharide deacetylase family protein [Bacteroidia bacterium]HNU34790.1 polysaccharide deacetylase family protein [Bacteroidia bacterium]
MLLVFTKTVTPRLRYIFDFFIKDLMGFEYQITHNKEEFKSFAGARLSYGTEAIDNEIFIYSEKLLFEKGIEDQQLSVFEWDGVKAMFATHPKYTIPFDVFAASFYLVSRYEEYLPHLRDSHDRFVETESIAWQKNFLQKPIVNIWAAKLRMIILGRFPGIKFLQQPYRYISTVDIDNAYAYREKGIMRTVGSYAKNVTELNFAQIAERTRVLMRMEQDPYDTYEFMHELHAKFKVHVIYFFLLGEYGENDKNLPTDNKNFQELIKSLADYGEAGIHPSYASNKKAGRLSKEIVLLSKILKREVTKSRQHFLKLRMPNTYRHLIDADISDDYTMGYAGQVGFRAGTCSTFYFYDLDLEQETNLKVHPFACMDATFKYYMKTDVDKVMDIVKSLVDEVRAVNGTFISLWHNESLSESYIWKGYKNIYRELVEYAHH